jgi:hypothetical protein
MTTTKDFDVIDKYGKRVRRNGILEDGDCIRVPMTLMDAANSLALRDASAQLESHQLSAFADAVNGGMSLADAIAKAKGLKRIEQFDARGHRPGPLTTINSASAAAHAARDARISDAWRTAPPVGDEEKARLPVSPTASHAELYAARDQAANDRDRRTENAWKS